MMKKIILFVCLFACQSAFAGLMLVSPTGKTLSDTDIPEFGGAVIDIVGENNNRVLSYIAEFELAHIGLITDTNGLASTSIGSLLFDQNTLDVLGGQIAQIAIRLTMWDGDNTLLNGTENGFHANKNFLYVNGFEFGNFSNVETQSYTRFGGTAVDTPGITGFLTDHSAVGWFSTTDRSLLDDISASLFNDGALDLDFKIKDAAANHANFISFSDKYEKLDRQKRSFTTTSVSAPAAILLFLLSMVSIWFIRGKRH